MHVSDRRDASEVPMYSKFNQDLGGLTNTARQDGKYIAQYEKIVDETD